MPARSNSFQAAVFFIKKHIAPDAEVVESAMLPDRVTGQLREVDVLVTAQIAGHPLAIGIEARDHKRPQGVEWVEGTHGKHRNLDINQTVLVARNGFTRSAAAKAEELGIQLVTPGEPIESGPLNDLRVQFEAKEVRWTGEARTMAWLGDPPLGTLRLGLDVGLFSPDGEELTSLRSYLMSMREKVDLSEVVASADDRARYLQYVVENPAITSSAGPVPIYLKNRNDGTVTVISRLQVDLGVQLTISQVDLTWGSLGNVDYGMGEGHIGEHHALIVVTEGDETGPRTSVRVTADDGQTVDLTEADSTRVKITPEAIEGMKARAHLDEYAEDAEH